MEEKVYGPQDFVVPKLPRLEVRSDFGVKRLIAIGDIHGCLDEFMALWMRLDIKDTDLVGILGDLTDRGPHSAWTVRLVSWLCQNRPGTFCVVGNHDEKHVRWRRHEVTKRGQPSYKNPMRAWPAFKDIQAEMTDEDVAWVAALPAAVVVETSFSQPGKQRILTHAGLVAGFGLKQPTSGLIRNRYLRLNTETGRYDPVPMNSGFAQPEGSSVWDEVWKPEAGRVIYGHIVHDLKEPRVHNDCYGIDTGCCFGGHLTAYVEDLETSEVSFVQVPAARTYFDREKGNDE